MDEFDDLVLQVIDKTIRHVFGDINAGIIYDCLEKKGCASNEIPTKPNAFSAVLRNILGSGRGQLLGAGPILEEAILEALCVKLKTRFDKPKAASFADNIKRLREIYSNKRDNPTRPIFKSGSLEHDPLLTQVPLQKAGGAIVARRKDKKPPS